MKKEKKKSPNPPDQTRSNSLNTNPTTRTAPCAAKPLNKGVAPPRHTSDQTRFTHITLFLNIYIILFVDILWFETSQKLMLLINNTRFLCHMNRSWRSQRGTSRRHPSPKKNNPTTHRAARFAILSILSRGKASYSLWPL